MSLLRRLLIAVAMIVAVTAVGPAGSVCALLPSTMTPISYDYDLGAQGVEHAMDGPGLESVIGESGAVFTARFSGQRGVVLGFGVAAKAAKAADEVVLSQVAKRRLAKELGGVPRSATPVAQGGSAKSGRWWEYKDSNGKLKIVVEHPDGTVHVGIPKPQSTHATGGPPKYYDYGNFGHVGD